MKTNPLILCKEDYKILMQFLVRNGKSMPLHNKKRLHRELKEARIVAKDNVPQNVVSSNSKVLLWNISKKQTFTVHLVDPEETIISDIRVSIYDTLAIALLGYAEGSIIEWELENGVNRLQLMSVSQPTEGILCA